MTRPTLAMALFLGPLRAGKGRLALSLAAIALGVALGYAVQLVNQAAINEFAHAVRTLSGSADLHIRGPRAGFDESLYPRLARMAEVAVASPVVEADARVIGKGDLLRLIGIDVFRAGQIQPDLLASVREAVDLLRPDAVFLSPAAVHWLNVKEGDTIRVQVGLGEVALRVAGMARAEGMRIGLMDIAGAQAALQRVGSLTRIDLRLRPGADVDAFSDRLRAELPPGVIAERSEAGIERAAAMSRAYRVNLNVLALVALFTGGLLVFSTQALAVVRRRAQLALLRVLGVKQRGLVALIVAEAALLGAVGSALGLAIGLLLAGAVLDVIGPDLGAGHFRGLAPSLHFDAGWALLFFALGVLVAVGGSAAPALEAGRAWPAAALKAGDERRVFERLQPVWPALSTIAAGALLTFAPPIGGLPILGYVAIALLLVGSIMLMPRVGALAFGAIRLRRVVPAHLALLQLQGAPGQAMVSLASVVASVSLLVSMAIMVASFRTSLDAWLERILPADLYLRAGTSGDTAFIGPAEQMRLARTAGVRRIDYARTQAIVLRPDRPAVIVIARTVDARDPALPLVKQGAVAPSATPPVWISEALADLYGHVIGDVIELPIGGGARFAVAGIWRDYVRTQGAAVIARDEYVRLTDDRNANEAALWLEPGAEPTAVRRAIQQLLPGADKLDIADPSELRRRSLQAFDRTFAITYVLEFVALVIGLTGLSSTFGALALARRREFGMLRHVGLTRRQIVAMLTVEGCAVTALGLAVGCVLGWLISLVLIHVVNWQSFHWSMDVHMPWTALLVFCVIMLAAATLTAIASARSAVSDAATQAVKDDW